MKFIQLRSGGHINADSIGVGTELAKLSHPVTLPSTAAMMLVSRYTGKCEICKKSCTGQHVLTVTGSHFIGDHSRCKKLAYTL